MVLEIQKMIQEQQLPKTPLCPQITPDTRVFLKRITHLLVVSQCA